MYPSICPESVAWSHGHIMYKGNKLSQSEASIGQFSQSEGGAQDMSHVGLMNTETNLVTSNLQVSTQFSEWVYPYTASDWLISLILSSYWLRRCLACDTIADMTPLIQESNWYILSWESLGTILFTHRRGDKELTSIRNINWSLLNVRGNF